MGIPAHLFSCQYQSKLTAGRADLELMTHVHRETFGVDVASCSGFVAARDAATAQSIWSVQNLPYEAHGNSRLAPGLMR